MKRPSDLKNDYKFWEITKDLIDQCIDVTLNLSQSGHPGGSRSKVHGMLITLLSAIIIEAKHECMGCRGVKKSHATMTTPRFMGNFYYL